MNGFWQWYMGMFEQDWWATFLLSIPAVIFILFVTALLIAGAVEAIDSVCEAYQRDLGEGIAATVFAIFVVCLVAGFIALLV